MKSIDKFLQNDSEILYSDSYWNEEENEENTPYDVERLYLPIDNKDDSGFSKEMYIKNNQLSINHNELVNLQERIDYINKKYATINIAKVSYAELNTEENKLLYYLIKLEQIKSVIDDENLKDTIKCIKQYLKNYDALKQQKTKKVFSNRLILLCQQQNISSEDLEKLLGVSQQTISSYQNADYLPSAAKLIKLAKFCNCSVDYLINDEVSEHNLIDDRLFKEIGIDSKSISFLKRLKEWNKQSYFEVIFTINALIHNHYGNKDSDLSTDVLTAISSYIYTAQNPSSLYVITDDNLSLLKDHLKDMKTTDELDSVFKSFKETIFENDKMRMNTHRDIENLHLLDINTKLKNAHEKLYKEYFDFLQEFEEK